MNIVEIRETLNKLPSCALRDMQQELPDHPDRDSTLRMIDCFLKARRRMEKTVRSAQAQLDELRDVYLALRSEGYCSGHIVDDLRNLINDAKRPPTEESDCPEGPCCSSMADWCSSGRVFWSSQHNTAMFYGSPIKKCPHCGAALEGNRAWYCK